LCLWGWAGLPAQAVNPDAALVYRRLAPRVVKVQAVEKSSGAKAAIGSGFFVSASGEVVTNYHVVSALVNQPDRYRADLIDSRDVSRPVEILAIDVVHDLAVLSVEPAGDPWFDLVPTAVERGTRLYSMGHPLDLGLSIVEGTYNGLLEHTLYPRIHFTGSINPGMSGGPTVTADGAVVGVNVSTAGEQVSFLVPAARVVALLREVRRADYRRPDSLLQTVASQLLAYQDTYLASLFADSTPTIALGGYLAGAVLQVLGRCDSRSASRLRHDRAPVFHRRLCVHFRGPVVRSAADPAYGPDQSGSGADALLCAIQQSVRGRWS
jgi:serine protease Do